MRKVILAAALALLLATSLLGATKRDFKTGKLIGATADEDRWAILTVQIGDLVYTTRGGRIHRRSGDIGQGLIIGDAVQVAVDRESLILLKPTGRN